MIKNFLIKYKRIIISSLFILFFLLILINILQNDISVFDNFIYSNIKKIHNDKLTQVMKVVTNMGGAVFIILVATIITFSSNNKKVGKIIFINLALITFANQTLKYIIARPRPSDLRLVEANGYSFPSRTFNG